MSALNAILGNTSIIRKKKKNSSKMLSIFGKYLSSMPFQFLMLIVVDVTFMHK